jgi:hypothetical protein
MTASETRKTVTWTLATLVLLGLLVAGLVLVLRPGTSGAPRHEAFLTNCTAVDIASFCNAELDVGWLPDFHPKNNLAKLPHGRQFFHGVTFDVRGVVQLQGEEARKLKGKFPAAVTNIPVGQVCRRLHVLHGAAWPEAVGTPIAKLVLHYADNQSREIPILYGYHALDWWYSSSEEVRDAGTKVGWSGDNPVSYFNKKKVRVFQTCFQNPVPEAKLESLDYISNLSLCAPFLIALSVEE